MLKIVIFLISIAALMGLAVFGEYLYLQLTLPPSEPEVNVATEPISPPSPSPSPLPRESELVFDLPAVTQDPFDDRKGPYYHQILKATSKDGLNFTAEVSVVFDKASVPDIIRLPDGRIFLYAVDGARRSISGIMVAFSEDNGETWRAGSLQMKSESGFGGADPEIVRLDDGRLRLYFVRFPAGMNPAPPVPGVPAAQQPKNQVLSAVSADGIHFEEEEGIRFEYPLGTDPDVVKIGTTWFMYMAQGARLVLAISSDGLQFKFKKTIRERGSVSNTVPIGENLWRQFFCDRGIRSATTSDGLTFRNDPGVRLAVPSGVICDPAPVQRGDTDWLLMYKFAEE